MLIDGRFISFGKYDYEEFFKKPFFWKFLKVLLLIAF